MSFENYSNLMRSKFSTGWANTYPVAYDNDDKFKTPNSPWVRFNIQHNTGNQASIGSPSSNYFRREGIIFASCFTKAEGGNKTALEMADDVINIFQGQDADGIHYYNCSVREIGQDQQGWYQVNCLISFRYDIIA